MLLSSKAGDKKERTLLTKIKDRMAILKFRVYLEEDDTVYRDVVIKHTNPLRICISAF